MMAFIEGKIIYINVLFLKRTQTSVVIREELPLYTNKGFIKRKHCVYNYRSMKDLECQLFYENNIHPSIAIMQYFAIQSYFCYQLLFNCKNIILFIFQAHVVAFCLLHLLLFFYLFSGIQSSHSYEFTMLFLHSNF